MLVLILVTIPFWWQAATSASSPLPFTQDGVGFSALNGSCSGSSLQHPNMSGYRGWPIGFTAVDNAFSSGVFDGSSFWLIPMNADRVVKVDPSTGSMTGYSAWPSGFVKINDSFLGGVFDGSFIWFIPYSADRVVRLDPSSGTMFGYNQWPAGFRKVPYSFAGGVFDGTFIWMVPYYADRVVRVDPRNGSMVGYKDWPVGLAGLGATAFIGGVFDGTFIWLVPSNADRIIRLDRSTGSMTGYNRWPPGFSKHGGAFAGGVFDGTFIWLVPANGNRIIRIDRSTGSMAAFGAWPSELSGIGSGAFAGGVFDGSSIWLVPYSANMVVRVNPISGAMAGYSNWPSGFAKNVSVFFGAVFDGSSIWLVPRTADQLVSLPLGTDCFKSLRWKTQTASPTIAATITPLNREEASIYSLSSTFSLSHDLYGWTETETDSALVPYPPPYTRSATASAGFISASPSSSITAAQKPIAVEPSQTSSLTGIRSSWTSSVNLTTNRSSDVIRVLPQVSAAVVVASVTTTAAASVAGAISASGAGLDLQSLFVVGGFRCNSTFLKRLSQDGSAVIVPLRIGVAPLSGLVGMVVLEVAALALHAMVAIMGFRLFRWSSFVEGFRKTGFPSGSIALCAALHQGTFVESLLIWNGDVVSTPAELIGSLALFLLVIGPAVACVVWPLVALKESFIPYQHVFKRAPAAIKALVLPQGYWTTEYPNSLMLRSAFGGVVAKKFCVFGLVGLVRSFSAAAVAVLGRHQSCAVQSWTLTGVIIVTWIILLVFRPYNTRLTLVLSTISSLLTAAIIVLNQFDGLDGNIEWLALASSCVALVGAVSLLVLKLLSFRWKSRELMLIQNHSESDGVTNNNSESSLPMLSLQTPPHSNSPPLQSPLLQAPVCRPTVADHPGLVNPLR